MVELRVEARRVTLHLPQLAEEQRAALVDDRELALSAGAGAGKTTTLAARYVWLLHRLLLADPEADVRAVLVLTFSETAAQEMRERCYQRVTEVVRKLGEEEPRLRAEGADPVALHRLRLAWQGVRDRFGAAAIHTFHGFCARLVREHPVETGTPPGADVADEAEATQARLDAAARALDTRLAAGEPEAGLLVEVLGSRAAVVEAVAGLLAGRGGVTAQAEHLAEGGFTVAEVLAASPVSPEEARRFLDEEWGPVVDALLPHQDVEAELFAAVFLTARAVRAPLGEDPHGFELLARYRLAFAPFLTKAGTPRKMGTAITKKAWKGRPETLREALVARVEAALTGWAPRLDALGSVPGPADAGLPEVLGALGRVLRDALTDYEAWLQGSHRLDFEAMLLRAAALLDAPDSPALSELRARHRFVMVDEFQDTDAAQWRIVEAIARPDGGRRDRLFFVGDLKQAIYGFRGGDVLVFRQAEASVGEAAGLATNRRSRPELIELFNALFTAAMGPPSPARPPWEAPYTPLRAGRDKGGGTVTIATWAGRKLRARDLEPPWVARWIRRELLDPGGSLHGEGYADPARHPRPPVAILLRSRTHLGAWERALRAEGIDHVVLKGVGFWSRPEVVDLVNLVVALTRGDPVARVGALRSPLFALDDPTLLALAEGGRLHSFGLGPAPSDLPAPARGAWARWAALDQLRHHATPTRFLDRVVRDTALGATLAWRHPDGRAQANLDALLARAEAHERAGGDLPSLAERWLGAVDGDESAAEATPASGAARVVLLTVHASKGLEFPVVVVPGLKESEGRRDGGRVMKVRTQAGWQLTSHVPDPAAPVGTTVRSAHYERLARAAKAQEAAESLRLFYVACTRAMDHLVLVGGEPGESSTADSWARHLAAWRATAPPAPWRVELDISPRPDGADPTPPTPRQHDGAPNPPTGGGSPTFDPGRLAPVPDRPRFRVAPSSLPLAAEDVDTWFQRHILRVPEVRVAGPGGGVNAAATLGVVLHGLLEDEALDDAAHAAARWRAQAHADGLDPAEIERGGRELERQRAALREDPTIAALFRRGNFRELGVALSHPPLRVEGRLDLLCRDPADGAWMVVDYKTQRLRPDSDPAEHRLQLLAYSVAASRVLAANGQPPVARAAVLYTRAGRLVRLPDWTGDDAAALDGLLARLAAEVRRRIGD